MGSANDRLRRARLDGFAGLYIGVTLTIFVLVVVAVSWVTER